MEYRLADMNDADRLADLRWQHKAEESDLDVEDREEFIKFCSDYLRTRLQQDDGFHCWVAVENRLIVSHIYIVTVKKVPKPEKYGGVWGYTTAVYTTPEYRNQGVGTMLMKNTKQWCKKQNFELLIVWPSERSVPFYERAGFDSKNDILELEF